MSTSNGLSINQIIGAMQKKEMKSLTDLLIPRPLKASDYEALQKVAAALRDTTNRVKTSLLYLEATQWDLHDALFMLEMDTLDREDSWVIEDNSGYPAAHQMYNIEFDRELAKAGDKFNEDMFEITYRTGVTTSVTVTFPEEAKKRFNKHDQDHVDDLNRWRRSKMWHLVGPEKGASHSQGEKWHPLQETYIRNRFALPDSDKAEFKSIHHDYCEVFEGVLLPSRAVPCGHRTQTAITSYLHREVIDNHDELPVSKALTRDIKRHLAKARLREKWDAQTAKAMKVE